MSPELQLAQEVSAGVLQICEPCVPTAFAALPCWLFCRVIAATEDGDERLDLGSVVIVLRASCFVLAAYPASARVLEARSVV